MQVSTSRFGVLEVEPEQLINFPQGMVGFPRLRDYFFMPVPENTYFLWMQAKDDPEIAFLVVDPFLFFSDYKVELSDDACNFLEIKEPHEATILVVATIPPQGVYKMTVNLLAPVVVNQEKHLAAQVILDSSGYRTAHPLFQKMPPAPLRQVAAR